MEIRHLTKGAALFEQPTRSGFLASSSSLSWPVYIFTDVPTGADQALSRGQSMHRLHHATLASSSSSPQDSDLESDERLAMLFEGSFVGHFAGRLRDGGVDAPILLDSGASANFVSPRLLKHLAVTCSPSSLTLRLADDSSAPILGKVRLRFRLQSFSCTATCYVTDLYDEFDLILGNSFMLTHKAVLDYSNYTASFRRHGKLYTLSPRSILTDKGTFPAPASACAQPDLRQSAKSLPLKDKVTKRANRAD